MGKNRRNGILALIGLGALAWWKYKKSTPEEKQKIHDKLNTAKKNLSKIGDDLMCKADDLRDKIK